MKCKVKRDENDRFISVINPETGKMDSLYKAILAKTTKDPQSYLDADDFLRGLYLNGDLKNVTKEEVALGIWAKVHQYWINTGTSPVERVVETPTQPKSSLSYYEGNITPEPNTIFVFGSNPEGRHGAGAAKVAKDNFGAIYGQGEGLQGNSYALPTKDLRVKENKGFKSISPEQIKANIKKLYEVAKQNPTKQFKVAYRNTTEISLNGYTGVEMIAMFEEAGPIPSNIIFSKEWFGLLKTPVKPAEAKASKSINIYSTDKNGYEKLSNLLNGPITTNIAGVEITVPTVEHLYQIKKAYFAKDKDAMNRIVAAKTGWDAQKLGRDVKGLDSKAWDAISEAELESAMRLGFEQNPKTKALLLKTKDSNLTHTKTNLNLGKWETVFPQILMKLRAEYSNKPTPQSTEGFEVQETLSDDIILPIKMSEIRPDKPKNEVQYEYEAVKILQSTKASEVFAKGKKNSWSLDKILHELQIPKEQKQLILDLGITDRAQIIIELVANYSFTVEINTTKEDKVNQTGNINKQDWDRRVQELANHGLSIEERRNILEKEFNTDSIPTTHYSNLTVPGGTNYTENEISTPLITPSIKGHAQFATSNGIGWFRSDDKTVEYKGFKKDNDWLDSESAVANVIEPSDKVIFGHPTIGKTFLKENGSADFISLDDDYGQEIRDFVNNNKGSLDKYQYQESKPKEFVNFTLALYDRVKDEAKKQNKKLFTSNNIILENRMNDFDKVINLESDEFFKRIAERNTTYDVKAWKSQIDSLISKVDPNKVITTKGYLSDLINPQVKTRRILEVQSDLFQKGRDKEFLVNNYKHTPGDRNFNVTYEGKEYKVGTMGGMQRVVIYKTLKGQVHYENPKQDWLTQEEIPQGLKDIVSNKFNNLKQEVLTQNKSNQENQFLQLLNKDNNWVTFFLKSILQDSAKKGYEKVLFPSGNTASKVEGHTTLEEFKKQKEDRIKELEDKKPNILESDGQFEVLEPNQGATMEIVSTREEAERIWEKRYRQKYINEINQLKQELERVETEGFAALKPIYNFYENTVTNILKKIDRVKKVTDEYGNTWNEISIDPIEGFDDIILPKIEDSVNELFTEYDDYIDGFESFQTFDKINEQIKSNIKFYDSRMATLKAEKNRLKAGDSVRNEKIKKELASYENKKSAAEAELKKAQTLDGVSGLEAFAANQLDEFERLIESDSALDVLDYVNTNIRFWRAVGDTDPTRQHILYAKEELFPEIMDRLSIIGARAIVLENTLAKKRLEATQTLMEEKLAGDKSTFWGELQNTSDINFWQQQALDLSAYGDSVLTLVQVLEKDAVSRAQLVIAELIQKFEAAYEPVKDKLGNNYEVLIQKYADGTPTNRLLYRFSPEFFTESKEARSRFENNPTNKKYEEFAKWITENEILMNPIILFPTKLGDDYHWGQSENMYSDYEESMRQKHIDELKATLGEKDYEMYVTRMKEKIERFTFQYNEEKRRLDGTALTAEEKEYALKDWELENSPYYWAQKVLNGKTLENSKGVTVRNVGYKFAESIPRRFKSDGSETGFYDKNYERIQNDPQLAAFYDELLDITSSLADMLPSDKRRELGVNGLPFLRKEITELFSKGNFVGMTKELFDQYVEMTRTKDFGNVDLSERDPLTGRKKFKAGLHLDTGEQAIKDLAQAKMVNYELTNAADLKTMSVAERAILKDHLMLQFRKEATAELQKDRSEDLVTTMKAYILATVMYRHKAAIENTLNAVAEAAERRNAFVIKGGKIQTHDDGSPVLAGHAKKKIEAVNFNIEAFLTGRTRKTQGITKKKVLTNPEKTRKESLDKLLLSAEEKYAAGEISLDAYNRHKEVIEEQLNNLGGVKESSKYGDLALRFVQLKGLGWNILSSINNITFGYVANSTEAAAGEFFNDYNLSTARKMLTSSMLTNASFNHWRDAKSKKIRKMIELYDILKDASTELYKSSNRSPIMSRFRFLNPFQLVKRTEYLNQGQTFIAFMLHEKIKDLQGNEVSLWEAFDTNGSWKTEEFGEMDLNRFSHTKTSVDQLIKRIHGNYDELSPLMGKSDIWGRALFEFKTWFPETLRKYFGKETPDHILGDMYKGRYRTLLDVFTADENKASTLGALLTEFLRKYLNVTSFGLIKNFSDENAFNALSKVDMLNMKRNIHQFIFIVNLNMMYYVIKYMADDDDDDKVFNATMNIALHQVSRLTGELELYSSPTQLSEFTKNLIPVTVIVRDLNDIMKAISKTISGDYYMQSGSYEGWYRPIKELGEAIPLVAPVMRYHSIGTGKSQSKEATLIEAVVGE